MLILPEGKFEAYLFDCDGTLADSMLIHYHAWIQALKGMNAPFTFDEKYHNVYGGVPAREFVVFLNGEFKTNLDPDKTAELKRKYYYEHVHETKPIKPVVEFFLSLSQERRCIVTGGMREMVKLTLRTIGLGEHLGHIVAAEDTAKGKPDPAPFLLAAQKLGVPPNQCLVFEDSPVGIEAATAAGMKYVLIEASRYR